MSGGNPHSFYGPNGLESWPITPLHHLFHYSLCIAKYMKTEFTSLNSKAFFWAFVHILFNTKLIYFLKYYNMFYTCVAP